MTTPFSLPKTNRKRERLKLAVGKQVEVRSDEDGFQGSWHAATVTACGVGFCKVRYLHLLDNDGKDYVADTINVSPGLDFGERDMRFVNNVRPLRLDVGFCKSGLRYGLCVDAFHNDAWWEGVVFDHEDGSGTRTVFFPDSGDQMKFEVGMLRQAWDWDECNEEWSLRGDWVFLKLVEESERDCPLTVSVKQLWYDLQEKECFNKVGMWKCRDEVLWREAMLEVLDCYFTMTVNYICDSLGCLTDMDSESGPSINAVDKTKMDLSSAIVTTKCASDNGCRGTGLQLGDGIYTVTSCAISEGKGGFDLDDGKSKYESFTHLENRVWLPAENVIVSDPEFCPDVISEYLQISENLRKNLTHKIRKHLLYIGWKIEYRKETSMTRMRYTSPIGKVYMSLVKVCEDMSKDSGALCILSEDKGSQTSPKDRSRKMLLGLPGRSQKPNVTSSTSPTTVIFEPEFCPQAIENWCKYINSNGSVQSQCRETNSLKAKKHLSAMGWNFSYTYRDKKRELRYMSPRGKMYYSLRKACEDCLKDDANVKFETYGRSKPTENMSIIETTDNHLSSPIVSSVTTASRVKDSLMRETTPHQLNVDLQHQPNALVEHNQLEVEEHQETRQNIKLDRNPEESARGKNRSNTQVRQASKSADRASKRIREAASHGPSHNNPRTVLSWLIDRNIVLPRAEVQYISRKNGQPLKTGQVSREGIWCNCCEKIYSLSAFEAHAGSSVRRPSANIFLKDGRSLMECQQQMLNKAAELSTEKKSNQRGNRAYPKNDILCSICHYAGELMLCDRCPASFHMICLGLTEIPDGDWFCPSCCCALCGLGEFNDIVCQDDVLRCYQCEHRYHVSCLKKRGTSIDMDAKGNRFCSANCKKICSGLNNLLGRSFALGSDNLTWTCVATNKCGSSQPDLIDMDTLTENYSKLNVALSIMHECFEPLKDPRTKRDIVEDVIFSRSSEYSRLNYRGFYTVILEQNEELISAATVRIFGDKVAEVPLVGTRFQYRRLGMCRFLMNELERKLIGLGIERLVLPAVPSVLKTWTSSFGFSQMTESERLQLLSYTFLDFQGTTMCQKFLQDKLPVNSTPSQGAQHEIESNKTVDYAITDELRTCDDSVVLVNQIRTYGPCTRAGLRQTSGILQGRSEEQTIAHGTLPSEQETEIVYTDQQATNSTKRCSREQNSCTFSASQQTPVICQMNCEEKNVPEMVQIGGCWEELKSIFEMHQSEHEGLNVSTDQQITNYQSDDKSREDPSSLTHLALQTIPATIGQMRHDASEIGHESHEEQAKSSETTPSQYEGLNNNTNQQTANFVPTYSSMVNDGCVQDQFSVTAHFSQQTPDQSNICQSSMGPSTTSSSTSLKRKSGCLDISDLKVYKRRVRANSNKLNNQLI